MPGTGSKRGTRLPRLEPGDGAGGPRAQHAAPMVWVLDLDGVVWLGDEPIPGAAEAVARLQGRRRAVAVRHEQLPADPAPTSRPSWPPRHRRRRRRGLLADGGGVVGRAGRARAGLRRAPVSSRHSTARGVEPSMPTTPTGARSTRSWSGFTSTSTTTGCGGRPRPSGAGARLIATNDDATYPTPTARSPAPARSWPSMSRPAASSRSSPASRTAMVDLVRGQAGSDGVVVGDRPDTDGRFARALGYRFGLVLTGVTTAGRPARRPGAGRHRATDLATRGSSSGSTRPR